MKIVLALGGNALQANPKDKSAESQLKTCMETAKSIVNLVKDGHTIAIVHGNGPQVGQILLTVEDAIKYNESNINFPFDVCGSFTQGYIGYHLQNAIKQRLIEENIEKDVSTIITEILVDKNDEGFKNPTKPIGSFYSKKISEKLSKEEGYVMKEDAGRGYRRVVPSPKPLDIIEKNAISTLIEKGHIVISCGGGGIPVIKKDNSIIGVDAVIDKDFAAEKLAEFLDADCLLILTAVEKVCINYNKKEEKELDYINLEQLNKYIEENQFAPGSMLPKIEACKRFIEFNPNKIAIISSLLKANEALKGLSGTRIIK